MTETAAHEYGTQDAIGSRLETQRAEFAAMEEMLPADPPSVAQIPEPEPATIYPPSSELTAAEEATKEPIGTKE
jgi:hypothetical protein